MSKTHKPNKGGRPPVDTEALTLRLHRDTLDAIEKFRREQAVIPTRPEAVRTILNGWLTSNGYLSDTRPIPDAERAEVARLNDEGEE